jgi:hypothetical protein
LRGDGKAAHAQQSLVRVSHEFLRVLPAPPRAFQSMSEALTREARPALSATDELTVGRARGSANPLEMLT